MNTKPVPLMDMTERISAQYAALAARPPQTKPELRREIQRLNRLVWTLVSKAGGRVELTMDDIWLMPEPASVTITPPRDGLPMVVTADQVRR